MAIPRQTVNLSTKEVKAALKSIITGRIFQGPQIKNFELQFAKYIGVKHALAVSSGRAAQYIALKSLNLDVGSEIIVPAYTFYIVPVVVKMAGFKPVFVDADSNTYNLNPNEIEKKITFKTRAIIATHIAGQPCDLDKIIQVAKKHNLLIIEDCAEACGSEYKGQKVGFLGDISFYSFHISKNLTCLGGGMVTTNDDKLFQQIQKVANEYHIINKFNLLKEVVYAFTAYVCTRPPIYTFTAYPSIILSYLINSDWIDRIFIEDMHKITTISDLYIAKISNLQASVGKEQLMRLEEMNSQRIKNSTILSEALKKFPNIRMQEMPPDVKSTYLYFYFQASKRKKIRKKLCFVGIDSRNDGLSACPSLAIFSKTEPTYAIAEQLVGSNIQLPNFPSLNEKQMYKIADKIRKVMQERNYK